MNASDYVDTRVRPRIKWYDARATGAKLAYFGIQYAAVISSLALLLVIHIEHIPRMVPTSLAAIIALLISIERIAQCGNRWVLYRTTAEALESEVQLHLHRSGVYVNEAEDADRRLVERCETILNVERSRWQQLIDEAGSEARVRRFPVV